MAVLAVLTLTGPSSVRADALLPLVTPVLVVPGDSLLSASEQTGSTTAAGLVATARSAYQTAWDQREAKNQAGALRTAELALRELSLALNGDLDASTRRELVDVQSKLTGLHDAARADLERPKGDKSDKIEKSDKGDKDDQDAAVLDAPAIEDIEPQYNAEVHRYIEYFTGAGRSVFERWLVRSGRYMGMFRDVLKKEGLPPDLVHLVFVESGFNVNARSVSAAVGPWQFLRSTGRLFGLTVNQWVDERKDPEKSTVAAARYLKHLYSIFGDWPLALASYNAGEGTVLRAIKRQGTTNYWDLRLPRQTEDYVPQFMAVLAISREPGKYGFDAVELDEPMNFDEIALRGSVDLRGISKLADCSYEEMKLLNPAVLKHAAPERDGVTMLRVPRGKAEVILGKLQDGAELPAINLSVNHRVRRGETLSEIANHYRVSPQQLAHANGISRSRPLRRGMTLKVPASLSRPSAAEIPQGDPRASTAYVPPRALRTPASLDAESDAGGRLNHTVHRGETLAMIAEQYGVHENDIRRWNHLGPGKVRRGTRLKIRTGEAAVASRERVEADSVRVASLSPPSARKSSAHRSHSRATVAAGMVVTVRAGETLGVLAERHNTTIAQLKLANGLSSSRIRAGQRLRIPA